MMSGNGLIEPILKVGSNHRIVDPSDDIAAALASYDEIDPHLLINRLFDAIQPGDTPSLLLRQPGDSERALIIGQPAFAKRVLPKENDHKITEWLGLNIAERQDLAGGLRINTSSLEPLLRASLIDHFNRTSGDVVDDEGKHIPIAVVSGPDATYRPDFSPSEKIKIMKGDLTPYATRMIGQGEQWGYDQFLVFGNSRGAVVGAAAVAMTSKTKQNFEILGGVLLSPVNSTRRGTREFIKAHVKDYVPGTERQDLTGSWTDDGPRLASLLAPGSSRRWKDNIWKNGNVVNNLMAIQGMARGAFLLTHIKLAAAAGVPTAVIYGEIDALAAQVGEVMTNDPEIVALIRSGLTRVMRVEGLTPHGYSANTFAYATLVHKGLRSVMEMRSTLN